MSRKKRGITRRDFLSGLAIGGAGLLASRSGGRVACAQPEPGPASAPYPPLFTGMRGSHPGSFETAHALRDGTFARQAAVATPTGERYDLVVVGGGPSGLAAAYYYQRHHQGKARILVLENHDDVGGHARRNELRVGNHTYLGFGGSFAIQS